MERTLKYKGIVFKLDDELEVGKIDLEPEVEALLERYKYFSLNELYPVIRAKIDHLQKLNCPQCKFCLQYYEAEGFFKNG